VDNYHLGEFTFAAQFCNIEKTGEYIGGPSAFGGCLMGQAYFGNQEIVIWIGIQCRENKFFLPETC
jgi:hypothetical protein